MGRAMAASVLSTLNRKASGIVLVVVVAQAVVVIAFLVPAGDPEPHGVPVGVTGAAAAVTETQAVLDRAAPGGFEVRGYPDEASATAGIRNREVYGALIDASPAPRDSWSLRRRARRSPRSLRAGRGLRLPARATSERCRPLTCTIVIRSVEAMVASWP